MFQYHRDPLPFHNRFLILIDFKEFQLEKEKMSDVFLKHLSKYLKQSYGSQPIAQVTPGSCAVMLKPLTKTTHIASDSLPPDEDMVSLQGDGLLIAKSELLQAPAYAQHQPESIALFERMVKTLEVPSTSKTYKVIQSLLGKN